ncbi:MAG: hypothetical protein ACRENT_01635 [Thermodesulfobacteriota bacterium]
MGAVLLALGKGPSISTTTIFWGFAQQALAGSVSLLAAFKFENGYKWTRYAFYVLAVVIIFNAVVGEIEWAKLSKGTNFI